MASAVAAKIFHQSSMMDDENSILNSKCVPVGGRLGDLTDNDNCSENDKDNSDEGGIIILDEATEEEYAESMHDFLKDHDAQHQLINENSQ